MAQTIGPPINELESGTEVGRVVFLGDIETRFVPHEQFLESGDDAASDAGNGGGADPDVCRTLLRELTSTLESAFDRDEPPVEEVITALDAAENVGCLDADDAERFRNRVRGLEGTRFQSMSAKRTAEELPEFFDLPELPTTFTITTTEGETVLELTEGDAIEVEFINTISSRRDSVQGVIESIRGAATAEGTFIHLANDVTFRPAAGASVRINDRSRGLLPRDEPPQENIRVLFGDGPSRPVENDAEADLEAVIDDVQERADALRAGDRTEGEPVDRCEELGPYIFAAIEPLERQPPSPFDDDVEALQDALFDLATATAGFMRTNSCGGSEWQSRARRAIVAIQDAVGSNKPATTEAVRDFRESFVEEEIPPTWTYEELAEQISSFTRQRHAGMTTPAAALHLVADVASFLRYIPVSGRPGNPQFVVAAARQKVADQWPDVRGWRGLERDPDFDLEDFRQVWEDALALLVRGEYEAAVPVLLNLRRGILESFGPSQSREYPLDFEFPDGDGDVPAQIGEWELIDDSPLTWRREGLHLNPPASVPRPGTTLHGTFETLVMVRQSQTRHHVDIRWQWDGKSETTRHADVTVGDTRAKAIEQAVEILEADDRHPD